MTDREHGVNNDNKEQHQHQHPHPPHAQQPQQQHHRHQRSQNRNNNSIQYLTLDEAIDIVGKGPFLGVGLFQFRLLFVTGFVWAADAMEMMLLSFLLPTLAKEWNLSGVVVSFVGAIVFFGMLIGGTALSMIADKFGRRKVVITANAGCAVFGFLSGIAPNLTAMLIIRFLVGIFIGAGCVGYTLFAEYIPTDKRGKLLVYVLFVCLFNFN